ncbi:MAG: tetratricopeptide repeat protein [Bacteroidales bacterium]|nr:tetratricopeptide repeat protein [Bacteroidales bacterium]
MITGINNGVCETVMADSSPILQQNRQKKNLENTKKIINLVQLAVLSQDSLVNIQEEDNIDKAYSLAKNTNNLGFLSTQLNYAGNRERITGHYPMALSLYSRSLIIAEQLKDTNLMTHLYNNIGVTYRKIDDYQNAMNYTIKALSLNTLIKDSLGMAISLNSLGNSQLQLGEYQEAMKSFKESLKLEQNRKNKIGLAINLNNIGNVFHLQKKYEQAISYYKLSLQINQSINSKRGIAICYNDLSEIYQDLVEYEKSKEYSENAIAISKEIDFKTEEANAYLNLGEIYSREDQNYKAIQNLNKGIDLMLPLGGKAFLEQSYNTLYKIYYKEKDYKKAMLYLQLAQNYHDSLVNLAVQNNIARLQIQFKSEQKENQIVLLNQKARLAEVSVNKQRYLIFFLLSAFLLMLIILSFATMTLRRRRENNRLLTLKNIEISEAKRSLERNEKELIKAKEEAEKNALAKGQIMADISHEIRTPLNSVIGFSELLYKTATDSQQKKYLEAIAASGRGLLNLINEILDSSKQGNEDQPLELSGFDLRESVQEVINIFMLKAEEKNISLKTIYGQSLPKTINFSKMLLQQILLNLVGNAIKFTNAGSVEVIVSSKEGTEMNSIQLELEVNDTGIGIPPEEQDRIFEPFYQIQSHTKHEGSGLGLSITENLVKRMNGTIRLISKENKGSQFIVTFDNIKATDETIFSDPINLLLSNIQKPPFLLLGQKEDVKKVVKRLFEESGFQLLDVGINLAEARKHFQNSLLTILCCLNKEELSNTVSILEKENLKQDHKLLVILKNSEPIEELNKNNIFSLPSNKGILSEKLHEFIKSYREEILTHILFGNDREILQKDEITLTFKNIFINEFKEAGSTHMLDIIRQLADKLNSAGKKYSLSNLTVFCGLLIQSINQFDTNAIEKQLSILEKAFMNSFNFK